MRGQAPLTLIPGHTRAPGKSLDEEARARGPIVILVAISFYQLCTRAFFFKDMPQEKRTILSHCAATRVGGRDGV